MEVLLKVNVPDEIIQSILYHLQCCGIHKTTETGKLHVLTAIEMFFEDDISCGFYLTEIIEGWLESCFDIYKFNEKINKKLDAHIKRQKVVENKQASVKKCPKCGTILITKYTEFIKDYCQKCHEGLVYVIDTETGKGKQQFFKDLIN